MITTGRLVINTVKIIEIVSEKVCIHVENLLCTSSKHINIKPKCLEDADADMMLPDSSRQPCYKLAI